MEASGKTRWPYTLLLQASNRIIHLHHYFSSSSYQYYNPAEMQHVICQEVGHTFSLDYLDG